jgi:hypothetical protein
LSPEEKPDKNTVSNKITKKSTRGFKRKDCHKSDRFSFSVQAVLIVGAQYRLE